MFCLFLFNMPRQNRILSKFRRYIGRRLLHRGGIGRLTPRVSYDTDDAYNIGDILMSDYHYISHPVTGGRGGYALEVDYQLSGFEDSQLPNIRLPRMIRLLKNNSSLISQAGLTFKQFFASGYRIEGSPRAKANIQKNLEMLERRRKPLPLLLAQMADGIFYSGGIYTEVVLDEDKETTIDFVVTDPLTAKFQLYKDKKYGEDFRLVKVDRDGWITSLDGDPSIQYYAINGDINSPFGKPFILGAIFPAVWQLLLLKDIRNVLRSQVYPFVHVKVDTEKMLEATGGDIEEATRLGVQARDTAIDQWKNKKADTAVGSGDEVSYEIISGLNRANMGMFDPIISVLSGKIASGAGMQPLFLGINESTTETNADVQWLIEIAIIRSVQTTANLTMTHNFNFMNQAAGIGGEVYFTLLEMNAMERLREAKIFIEEEEALIKLIDHLTKAFADGVITAEQMIERYEQRRDQIYRHTQLEQR